MAFFNITSSAEFTGASVIFPDGTTRTIASDHKNYEAVKSGLLDGSLTDDELLTLIAPFEAIYKSLTKLSERVSRKGNKLLFDGDVVNTALSGFILDLMNEGQESDWRAYINFMEKLYTNPSEQSREHLFHFIKDNGLQVTADGDMVLYKGTKTDGKSTHAGYGIVNGVEFEREYLQNDIGYTVEIPRGMVDANRSSECSVGLHVGAFEYVTGKWAGTWPLMWVVLVNPRDVVAVPHDFHSSKIRVTRYFVVEKLGATSGAKKHQGLVWTPPAVAPVEPPKPEPEVEESEVETPAEPTPEEKVVANVVKTGTASGGSRVEEYKSLIQSGGAGKDLKRFRNKRVTPARRAEFDEAVKALGLQY